MDLVLLLNQPISGSDTHLIADAHKWHARLMVLGWGVFIPTGIVVARYFKILVRQDWPRQLDNRRWWHAHLALQVAGLSLSFVAVFLAFRAAGAAGSGILPYAAVGVHETLGWAIVALGVAQLLGGALRGTKGDHGRGGPGAPVGTPTRAAVDAASPAERRAVLRRLAGTPAGDHYLMTVRRRAFEYLHKVAGYVALALSAVNILIGLAISDAFVWMWLVIVGYWVALGALALVLQRQGRCVDTYQAIYGPDVSLPGNARPPIGWGVRRYDAGQWPPARSSVRPRGPVAS